MNIVKTESVDVLPESATNYWFNLFCLIFFFAAMVCLRAGFPSIEFSHLTMICLLATVIPLWIYDFFYARVHQRPSADLVAQPGKLNKERFVIKLIGLYGTFTVILFYYYVIYTFCGATYLKVFLDLTVPLFPWIIILCFIYFLELDRRQKNPYDEYWHMGCLLTGRFKEINSNIIKEYVRAWFIKGFFTPYMVVILVRSAEGLLSFNWDRSFFSLYNYLLDLFYTIDVVYGVLGYILTCRLLDTHIRSTEPTFLGWLVCLICYGPFYSYLGLGLLDSFDDGFNWNHWFALSPVFYYFYGMTIIFLSLVYCLATVAFGYRMSNLTYRGIITSGPYRFTKHPAYLCKVASWWLIALPFLSAEGSSVAIKNTMALSVITFIYYLRARTEENHLSNYPEYVNYAKWINQHGVFSFITKHFPALQYSEEKCKRWGSVVWFKKGHAHNA